jgi:hypothetical protein
MDKLRDLVVLVAGILLVWWLWKKLSCKCGSHPKSIDKRPAAPQAVKASPARGCQPYACGR